MRRIFSSKVFWFICVIFLTLGIAVFSEYAPPGIRKGLDAALQGPLGKGFHLPKLEEIFGYSIYYFLWAQVIFLILAWRKAGLNFLWQRLRFPLLCGLGLTTIVFLAVPPDFRVLADETNLLATSLSLYHERGLYNVLQVLPYYDMIHIINQELAARPAFYPFLISLLHTVFGYHWQFGFVVNFGVGIVLIATMIYWGERVAHRSYGIAAGILVAAFPVFAVTVTSAGFDTINAAMMTLVFVQLRRFLDAPTSRETETLILLTLLAGQCRYESILLALPVGIAMLLRFRQVLAEKHSWRFPLLPLMVLPIFWQRILNKNAANAGDEASEAFGLKYVAENLEGMLKFFLKPWDNPNPTAFWIVILAGIGFLFFVDYLLRHRLARAAARPEAQTETQPETQNDTAKPEFSRPLPTDYLWFALVVIGILLPATVHVFYYFGNPEKPWVARLTMIYVPFLCAWAAYALWRLLRSSRTPALVILPSIFLLLYYLPQAQRNDAGKSLMLFREFKKVHSFLKDKPIDAQLIIAGRPGMYTALGRGAVNFGYANKNPKHMQSDLERHLFTDVWIIQHIQYATGEPEEGEELDPLFKTEPVFEFQNSAEEFMRISRLLHQPELAKDD